MIKRKVPEKPKPETVEQILQKMLDDIARDFPARDYAQDVREDTESVIEASDAPAIATVIGHAVEVALDEYMKQVLDDLYRIVEVYNEERGISLDAELLARDLEDVLHTETSKTTWLNVRDILGETLKGLKKVS